MPPGGQKALEVANNQLAVLKIQARFRGSSIRRVLGTGIRHQRMSFVEGDHAGSEEVTVLGRDGVMRRKREKKEVVEGREGGGEGKGTGAKSNKHALLVVGRRKRATHQGRKMVGGLAVAAAKIDGGVLEEAEEEEESGDDEFGGGDRRAELFKRSPLVKGKGRRFFPVSPLSSPDGGGGGRTRRVANVTRRGRKLRLATGKPVGGDVVVEKKEEDKVKPEDEYMETLRSLDKTEEMLLKIQNLAPDLDCVAKRYAVSLRGGGLIGGVPVVEMPSSAPTVPPTPNYVSGLTSTL